MLYIHTFGPVTQKLGIVVETDYLAFHTMDHKRVFAVLYDQNQNHIKR